MKTFEFLLLFLAILIVGCSTGQGIINKGIESNIQTPYGSTEQINQEVNTLTDGVI